MTGDLTGLEAQVAAGERLEELGPDYGIEEDPLAHRVEGEWIRDVTLGANDGLVSILTLLAGVAAATTGPVVLLAGLAGLVAGAISMGVGAYVSAKAYRAFYRKELAREMREMEEVPEIEREEIREIYRQRGFEGELLEVVVRTITSRPKVWLKVMMSEELGLSAQFARPLGAGAVMFVSFLAGGVVPIVPFLFASGTPALLTSFAVTATALMVAGAVRTRFTGERGLLAGLELVAMATAGVGAAYLIGRLVGLSGIAG
ncbi:MAG: VIT1/CCC1 transporter family protein [Actinomycetota bacterium]|nr:VIT1/CCC1 transporter family protein [Actinomycetota bacterium]